jgi:hypothetical protein
MACARMSLSGTRTARLPSRIQSDSLLERRCQLMTISSESSRFDDRSSYGDTNQCDIGGVRVRLTGWAGGLSLQYCQSIADNNCKGSSVPFPYDDHINNTAAGTLSIYQDWEVHRVCHRFM